MIMLIGPPKNNLFLITSCINTNHGIYNPQERLNQTYETINSIRDRCSNSLILIADNSSRPLDDKIYALLSEKCDFVANISSDQNARQFNDAGLKSAGDAYLLMKMIELMLSYPNAMKLVSSSNRIFKISGRYKLNDNFDISKFNYFGKYVFKRHDTWKDNKEIPALYITRLFSLCPSLLKYTHSILDSVIKTVINPSIDFEHALYKFVDKKYVQEIDTLGLEGNVAPNGQLHVD